MISPNSSTTSPLGIAQRIIIAVLAVAAAPALLTAATLPAYYGHEAVHDGQGVIAPRYRGLNGQCDYRVRIAAETLKRYPWTTSTNGVAAYPHYIFNGFWQISTNGAITPMPTRDWGNGDLGQRATSAFNGWVDYYRYTGDPAAIAHVSYMAGFILDHCLTPPDHPWPGLFISVPTKGKLYGQADEHGIIQLDICASVGRGLLRAYQLTGNRRWFEAAAHWGDLFAAKCNLSPGAAPWPRYANPEDSPWIKVNDFDKQTGSVSLILAFLDELIRLGHSGEAKAVVHARDAGWRYLRGTLLPAWTVNDTWGRYFWDWPNPVQNCLTTPDAASYLLDHPGDFPNWRNDARNVLTLFLGRSSVNPKSGGDVFSGAWAYPESSSCCGRSLWYSPLCVAPTLAQWAVLTDSAWGRELAYRQMVLQTYDADDNGVSQDNIDGGVIVNGSWLNIAHPLPLRFVQAAIGWLPEELGASRENHIVRSSAVVNSIVYGAGQITYSTFDAPAQSVDVLRLAFVPKSVIADHRPLRQRSDLRKNGYTLKALPNGDAIVSIRHDGCKDIAINGDDPQQSVPESAFAYNGEWHSVPGKADASDPRSTTAKSTMILPGHDSASFGASGLERVTESAGAAMTIGFTGNQVRLIGRAEMAGGLADVYLDAEKQLVPIDCWNPSPRDQQVLYYRNGLATGPHTLRIVTRGEHNACSQGDRVAVERVLFSAADQPWNFPAGTGPTDTQRMIFGRTSREDYRDSRGHLWRPGTEFVIRLGSLKDSVADSWWTQPSTNAIAGTRNPELYRFGVHGAELWVNLTVGPGRYYARLLFAAAHGRQTQTSAFNVLINGEEVAKNLNVAATAGGSNRALDLVFNDLAPQQGIIEIRLKTSLHPGASAKAAGEAFLQALEIGLGRDFKGTKP